MLIIVKWNRMLRDGEIECSGMLLSNVQVKTADKSIFMDHRIIVSRLWRIKGKGLLPLSSPVEVIAVRSGCGLLEVIPC